MSPYANKQEDEWLKITQILIDKNPITEHIVKMCLNTWESILNGKINSFLNLTIRNMSLSPQALSNLFHDILPEYIERNLQDWEKGANNDKDIINTKQSDYSFEIKVSSSQNSIFGNRSYGKKSVNSKKSKDGYYLAINIDKLDVEVPRVRLIRFGWLDHSDWISQSSETGQQARLHKKVMDLKLITLYKY